MRAGTRACLAFVILSAAALPAAAQVTEHQGQIVRVYPDPGDFVVELNVAGRCGSRFFHSQRGNANFREMVAAAYTAFAASRPMGFYVVRCQGDRNIASHGYIVR